MAPSPSTDTHLDTAAIEAGLDHVRASPTDIGTVELLLCRPGVGERTVLATAELNVDEGIAGDNWNQRSSKRTADGGPHPDMQLNVMNARFARLIAGDPGRMALAGDQIYLDLDLSFDNLPAGTRLALGTAVIEVTDQPHTGCAKFTDRFGLDAHRMVNSEAGTALRLRGLNAKVVEPGTVSTGEPVRKLA